MVVRLKRPHILSAWRTFYDPHNWRYSQFSSYLAIAKQLLNFSNNKFFGIHEYQIFKLVYAYGLL